MLNAIDKNRAIHLKFYTGQIFGKSEKYNLCVDSGKLGIETTVKMLEIIYRTLE